MNWCASAGRGVLGPPSVMPSGGPTSVGRGVATMRRSASSRSRGAAAAGAVVVNTALVAPLLVLIVLGIAETAFLMKDNVALTSLVRQSGDAAATTLVRQAGHTPEVAGVTSAMTKADAALANGAVSELWIYKADSAGFPAGNRGSDHFAHCATDCLAYTWDAGTHTFDFAGGDWDAADIDACSDDVGVYMKASHDLLTGVFSRGIDISKHETFHLSSSAGAGCALVSWWGRCTGAAAPAAARSSSSSRSSCRCC